MMKSSNFLISRIWLISTLMKCAGWNCNRGLHCERHPWRKKEEHLGNERQFVGLEQVQTRANQDHLFHYVKKGVPDKDGGDTSRFSTPGRK